MKKYLKLSKSTGFLFVLSLACSLLSVQADAQIDDFFNKAKKTILGSDDDVGAGLKQALEFGVNQAVENLSKENGYFDSPYKILVPPEAQTVIDKLQYVPGFENVERDLVAKMNQAAEIAAKKATPIFVDAIKQLTFEDAMKILTGEHNAATMYLEDKTRGTLYDEFMPVIQGALDEVNAREYWRTAVDSYNKIPFVKKVNPELDDYVNNKGLDGLFGEIEKKERGIRENQDQRTTELLQRVFAQQDK